MGRSRANNLFLRRSIESNKEYDNYGEEIKYTS